MDGMNRVEFPLAQFGTRLGTRLEGKRAREKVTAALASLPDDGQLVVVLDGVDVLSGSFADEVLARTVQEIVGGLYPGRTLVVWAPSRELVDDLEHKLERRRLAMLGRIRSEWILLGAENPALAETLHLIIARRQTTTKELAEALGLPMNTCANRVARLADLRLVRRDPIGKKGRQSVYAIHSIVGD
jgi:hypothetical protein